MSDIDVQPRAIDPDTARGLRIEEQALQGVASGPAVVTFLERYAALKGGKDVEGWEDARQFNHHMHMLGKIAPLVFAEDADVVAGTRKVFETAALGLSAIKGFAVTKDPLERVATLLNLRLACHIAMVEGSDVVTLKGVDYLSQLTDGRLCGAHPNPIYMSLHFDDMTRKTVSKLDETAFAGESFELELKLPKCKSRTNQLLTVSPGEEQFRLDTPFNQVFAL